MVEVIVALAIALILVGMLFPAIQCARESAHRIACGNNHRQIGIGLLNYHEVHLRFPPNIQTRWGTSVLPQMEKADLFARYDHALEPWDPRNLPVLEEPLPVFVCPSGPALARPDRLAQGTYGMNAEVVGISIGDIADGTTQTVLCAELKNSPGWVHAWGLGPVLHVVDPIQSNHPAGLWIVLCDGGSRILTPSVAARVLDAIVTPAGGEVLENY